jgi:hypothetical protein
MYLISLTGIGGIAVFVFTCLNSAPGTNKWALNPKGEGVVTPGF